MKWMKVGLGINCFFLDKRYERSCWWHYKRADFVKGFYKLLRNYEVSRISTIKYQVLLMIFLAVKRG